MTGTIALSPLMRASLNGGAVPVQTIGRDVTEGPLLHGHGIDSAYVETVWLPVIGPTAWCMARHLRRRLETAATNTVVLGFDATLHEFGAAVGVKAPVAAKAIQRLARFGLVVIDDRAVRVPLRWPDVPPMLLWRRHKEVS